MKIICLVGENRLVEEFECYNCGIFPNKKSHGQPILRQSKMMARVILVPMAPKPSAKTQYEIYESIHLQ